MLKKLISTALSAAMLMSLGACGGDNTSTSDGTAESTDPSTAATTTAATTVTEEGDQILDKSKSYSILFIGNSYTYYNGMPEEIFAPLAEAAGYTFNVKQLTKGGWDLIRSSDAADELGKLVDEELKATKYDYIVLQEQSTNPAVDPGKFYDGIRSILPKIEENGATPILYSTWGRKTGSETLEEYSLTNETMTWKIAASYEAIAEEINADVAHVGLAFYDVYTNHDERGINIYGDDLTHPSYKGSLLAAMTIFAKITGTDPTTVDFRGDCPNAIAPILREAARKAVFETPAIPAEYTTSSEGVTYTAE